MEDVSDVSDPAVTRHLSNIYERLGENHQSTRQGLDALAAMMDDRLRALDTRLTNELSSLRTDMGGMFAAQAEGFHKDLSVILEAIDAKLARAKE